MIKTSGAYNQTRRNCFGDKTETGEGEGRRGRGMVLWFYWSIPLNLVQFGPLIENKHAGRWTNKTAHDTLFCTYAKAQKHEIKQANKENSIFLLGSLWPQKTLLYISKKSQFSFLHKNSNQCTYRLTYNLALTPRQLRAAETAQCRICLAKLIRTTDSLTHEWYRNGRTTMKIK